MFSHLILQRSGPTFMSSNKKGAVWPLENLTLDFTPPLSLCDIPLIIFLYLVLRDIMPLTPLRRYMLICPSNQPTLTPFLPKCQPYNRVSTKRAKGLFSLPTEPRERALFDCEQKQSRCQENIPIPAPTWRPIGQGSLPGRST